MYLRGIRKMLRRYNQLWHGIFEPPTKKMYKSDEERMSTWEVARAEPHCSLDVVDREVGPAAPYPELGAYQPATRKARIEHECAINERQHGIHVLAEIRERVSGIDQGVGIIAGAFPARAQRDR